MAIEEVAAVAAAAREISETAHAPPTSSPDAKTAIAGPARPRGWLRRLVPREYRLPRSRRWKLQISAAAESSTGRGGPSKLASSLSRSLRWKRLPGFPSLGLSLKTGSAAAVVDAVTFRVMYVVEAVVLGLGLSCFFLCCGCHL